MACRERKSERERERELERSGEAEERRNPSGRRKRRDPKGIKQHQGRVNKFSKRGPTDAAFDTDTDTGVFFFKQKKKKPSPLSAAGPLVCKSNVVVQ